MKTEIFINTIGWYGVIAILVAYALVTLNYVSADNLWYITLNATGALALAVQTWYRRNWQLVVLNIVWLAVALVGAAQTLLQ